jgi:HK97 family phage major capsid protein/HK97 family phage prohead protease
MQKVEVLKLPPLSREMPDADLQIRVEDKVTRLTFSASSEAPIERWFGEEILSHDKKAIRLERVKRGAMPLLFNHDFSDPIGIVDDARVEKERLIVDAHLFDTDRAVEVASMLRGGLKNVSIGYRLHVVEEDKKTGTFTARDWEPYETSIVTVPADPTVGIGRQMSGEELEVRMVRASQPADSANQRKGTSMKTDAELAAEREAAEKEAKAKREKDEREAREQAEREAQEKLQQRSTLDLEQSRVRAVTNLAQANRITENIRDTWIRQGYNLEQVSNDILKILEERGKANPQPASRLGLTAHETQRFSLARAIVAAASKDNDWSKAGFELECSRAVAQKLGKIAEAHRFYVPFEVIERPIEQGVREYLHAIGRRDLTVATAGAGGFLVGTENVGFIEMLRNRSVAFRMGVRRLSGLQGSVTVPRQSAGATAIWLANEASTITESQQTFVQMALSPKNVGAYTEISRQLLLQSSPGAEGIVTDDLAQVTATAADLAVLEGSGAAGQPTGLANTAGIGNVAAGAATYAKVLEFQEDVATANVMPARGGYVTHPATASILMQKQRFTSTDTPLWVGNIWDGQVSGFPGMSSNQLASGVVDFGDWQEIVVGEWGVLEVEVNPYANFQAGIIGVRAIYSLDVGVRRPFAFSRATGITA